MNLTFSLTRSNIDWMYMLMMLNGIYIEISWYTFERGGRASDMLYTSSTLIWSSFLESIMSNASRFTDNLFELFSNVWAFERNVAFVRSLPWDRHS